LFGPNVISMSSYVPIGRASEELYMTLTDTRIQPGRMLVKRKKWGLRGRKADAGAAFCRYLADLLEFNGMMRGRKKLWVRLFAEGLGSHR
jgi:hypothetical protein